MLFIQPITLLNATSPSLCLRLADVSEAIKLSILRALTINSTGEVNVINRRGGNKNRTFQSVPLRGVTFNLLNRNWVLYKRMESVLKDYKL